MEEEIVQKKGCPAKTRAVFFYMKDQGETGIGHI